MLKNIIIGILFAVIADAVWGLAFIIPKLLPDYGAVDITFGRYFTYGIFSVLLILIKGKKIFNTMNKSIWKYAIIFAFCGNVGYYFFLVLSIKLTGATISTLIIGILPISTSLYGNFINHEFSFKKLFPSIGFILIGIIVLNYESFNNLKDNNFSIYGILCSFIALCLWTWYAIANARFLKENSKFTAKEWSTITGMGTLCLLPFLVIIMEIFMPKSLNISSIMQFNNSMMFWIFAIVLGVIVSWSGTIFWNKASNLLPISLVGQMTVGETIFGLTYSFMYELRLPNVGELIGIVMIVGGVLLGIRILRNLRNNVQNNVEVLEQE